MARCSSARMRSSSTAPSAAPTWDRFAVWGALPARLLLVALIVLLAASALVPINAGRSTVKTANFVEVLVKKDDAGLARKRDEDLALYDRAIERIRHGENYYQFIVAEQRLAHYPVRPGLAVRLPTLAYLDAWAGVPGQFAAAIVLLIAVLLAWWQRLGLPGLVDLHVHFMPKPVMDAAFRVAKSLSPWSR